MKNSKPELLSTYERSSVSFCKETNMVIWYYKHALITFFKSEFFVFVDRFSGMNFWEHSFLTDDQGHAILLDTCHLDIRLVILYPDFFGLQELFKQSAEQLKSGPI